MGRLSIIVPTLDEAAGIAACLGALAPLRARGAEVIVVDGGSGDATAGLAAPLADRVIAAARGRAAQMNAGAAVGLGRHAPLPARRHAPSRWRGPARARGPRRLAAATGAGSTSGSKAAARCLPVIATLMNLRSRLTGIATGDQAIFARRGAFERAGGFPAIPLMEDIAFSKSMKREGPPALPRAIAS